MNGAVLSAALRAFPRRGDFLIVKFICNSGQHLAAVISRQICPSTLFVSCKYCVNVAAVGGAISKVLFRQAE